MDLRQRKTHIRWESSSSNKNEIHFFQFHIPSYYTIFFEEVTWWSSNNNYFVSFYFIYSLWMDYHRTAFLLLCLQRSLTGYKYSFLEGTWFDMAWSGFRTFNWILCAAIHFFFKRRVVTSYFKKNEKSC